MITEDIKILENVSHSINLITTLIIDYRECLGQPVVRFMLLLWKRDINFCALIFLFLYNQSLCRMKKNIIVLLLLVALATCLRISHLEDSDQAPVAAQSANQGSEATETATETETESAAETSPEAETTNDKNELVQAYARLLEFIGNDKTLTKNILKDIDDHSEKQERKLKIFLAGDKYFQKLLLGKLLQNPENQWIKQLDFGDQIKYIQITSALTTNQLLDPEKKAFIIKVLLEDPEIGAALKKKYGEEINVEDIMKTSSVDEDTILDHQLSAEITQKNH